MKVTGIDGMEVVNSHQDVNGKWGGYKAWVVHFAPPVGPSGRMMTQRMEIYRHIGDYYKVGNWPDDKGASRWEVIDQCIKFMDGESSIWELIETLFSYWYYKMFRLRKGSDE